MFYICQHLNLSFFKKKIEEINREGIDFFFQFTNKITPFIYHFTFQYFTNSSLSLSLTVLQFDLYIFYL